MKTRKNEELKKEQRREKDKNMKRKLTKQTIGSERRTNWGGGDNSLKPRPQSFSYISDHDLLCSL